MSAPKDVSLDDWVENMWKKGEDPPFHLNIVHPMLEKFYDKLFRDEKPSRVFVPLCGKTLDMIYLADRGHEVIGLEYVKLAVDSFFEENNLSYAESKIENEPFVKYVAKEKKITIYQGDIFALKPELVGKFDAAWDRGGFRAINMSTREAYMNIVRPILKPGGRILMEVADYDPVCNDKGSPFPLAEEDIPKYFGKNFEIEIVDVSEKKAPPFFKPGSKFFMRTMLLSLKK